MWWDAWQSEGMALESRQVSVFIDRPTAEVYEFTANPANLPQWAPGLCDSVEQIAGQWVAQSPFGRVVLVFAPPNDYGVLDHQVTVDSGQTFYNPMRVTDLDAGCELVFSVRRQPDLSDEQFATDSDAVLADLVRLKHLLEAAAVS